MTETLNAWGTGAYARVGFLDPMQYGGRNLNGDETDSTSHRQWLRLLADGFPHTIISVHFTGHRNHPTLQAKMHQMYQDGLATGYQHALVAHHGNYHVVCNVKHPDGENAGYRLAVQLRDAVQAAWDAWFRAIGRRKSA